MFRVDARNAHAANLTAVLSGGSDAVGSAFVPIASSPYLLQPSSLPQRQPAVFASCCTCPIRHAVRALPRGFTLTRLGGERIPDRIHWSRGHGSPENLPLT